MRTDNEAEGRKTRFPRVAVENLKVDPEIGVAVRRLFGFSEHHEMPENRGGNGNEAPISVGSNAGCRDRGLRMRLITTELPAEQRESML